MSYPFFINSVLCFFFIEKNWAVFREKFKASDVDRTKGTIYWARQADLNQEQDKSSDFEQQPHFGDCI